MDFIFYQKCVENEVYFPYVKPNIIQKIWCRYIRPESNAVYIVRKIQLYNSSKLKVANLYSKFLEIRLMKKYGIWVHPQASIDIGFRIYHPHGIFITNVKIGKNFTVFQNCTLGVKKIGEFDRKKCPEIGDNVIMYANSSIVGSVVVASNSEIGANSCLVNNSLEAGIYVGSPAKLIKRKLGEIKNG